MHANTPVSMPLTGVSLAAGSSATLWTKVAFSLEVRARNRQWAAHVICRDSTQTDMHTCTHACTHTHTHMHTGKRMYKRTRMSQEAHTHSLFCTLRTHQDEFGNTVTDDADTPSARVCRPSIAHVSGESDLELRPNQCAFGSIHEVCRGVLVCWCGGDAV